MCSLNATSANINSRIPMGAAPNAGGGQGLQAGGGANRGGALAETVAVARRKKQGVAGDPSAAAMSTMPATAGQNSLLGN